MSSAPAEDDGAWRIDVVAGVPLARCASLAGIRGIAHAFSLRSDREASHEELRIAAGLALEPEFVRQVHGRAVADVPANGREADGLFSGSPLCSVAVRTADCCAVLIADARARAVCALHAGWRGVAARIAPAAVGRFERQGISAADLHVAIGPRAGPCCYVVGPEVARAIEASAGAPSGSGRRAGARDSVAVDLGAALVRQFLEHGVAARRISSAPWCTICRPDLCHSFRRDGAAAGRMIAAVGPGAA